jgi:hypothetical protein
MLEIFWQSRKVYSNHATIPDISHHSKCMKESMLVRTTFEALVNMKESMLARRTFEALVIMKESMLTRTTLKDNNIRSSF